MRARRLTLLLVTAAAALALGAAYALADDVITSSAACCTYASPTFTITGGQVAQFRNATTGGVYGGASHSVTANDTRTLGGRPLFASATIPGGRSAAVKGTQYLAPGDYVFHCAVHGPAMSATLHVAGGTPVARPRLKLAITSAKLAAVRRSGKLEATLADAGSDAHAIALEATLAGAKLAAKKGIEVGAGASERVALKLSKNGRKALRGRGRATVELAATVAFGARARTTKTLR
jgi:plastocyanin